MGGNVSEDSSHYDDKRHLHLSVLTEYSASNVSARKCIHFHRYLNRAYRGEIEE